MIRYGVIGCGMMGQEHISNIRLCAQTQISCMADPDAEMLAQAENIAGDATTGYVNYQDLLDSGEFDALVIATPNHTHAPIMQQVLKTDPIVPVLIEKPLGITSQQCREITEEASARNQSVWVAMEYRYMPPVARLLDAVRDGVAGNLHMVSIREHRYPFLPKVGDWNRFNENTGGTLVEKCCHFFDLFSLIAESEPVRIYASAAMDVNHLDERYEGRTPDIIDNAYVVVDFENGVRAMLDLCMFAEGTDWQEQIKVTGSEQSIELFVPGPAAYAPNSRGLEARLVTYPRDGQPQTEQTIEVDQTLLDAGHHHGASFYQHQKFQQLIRGETDIEVGLKDGFRAVAMGEAAQHSAQTGIAVDLRDWQNQSGDL